MALPYLTRRVCPTGQSPIGDFFVQVANVHKQVREERKQQDILKQELTTQILQARQVANELKDWNEKASETKTQVQHMMISEMKRLNDKSAELQHTVESELRLLHEKSASIQQTMVSGLESLHQKAEQLQTKLQQTIVSVPDTSSWKIMAESPEDYFVVTKGGPTISDARRK